MGKKASVTIADARSFVLDLQTRTPIPSASDQLKAIKDFRERANLPLKKEVEDYLTRQIEFLEGFTDTETIQKTLDISEIPSLIEEIIETEERIGEQIKEAQGKRRRLLKWVQQKPSHNTIRMAIEGCRDEKTRKTLIDSITGEHPAISFAEMEDILAGK